MTEMKRGCFFFLL